MSAQPSGLAGQPRASAMGFHMAITTGREEQVLRAGDEILPGGGAGAGVAELEKDGGGGAGQVGAIVPVEDVVDQLAGALRDGLDGDRRAGGSLQVGVVEGGGHVFDPGLLLGAIGEEETDFAGIGRLGEIGGLRRLATGE